MTPESALLADIIAHPDNDGYRLIYADWLEENNQGDKAEFVRLGITLAREGLRECQTPALDYKYSAFAPHHLDCGGCTFCRTSRRIEELMNTGAHTSSFVFAHGMLAAKKCLDDAYAPAVPDPCFFFRRGFPAVIVCTQKWWLQCGARAAQRAPIEEVRLIDRAPASHGLFSAWYTQEFDSELWTPEPPEPHCYLSRQIYDLLPGGFHSTHYGTMAEYEGAWHGLPNAATEALSTACLLYARNELQDATPEKVVA